jgi:hypothetical protein
MLKIQLFISRVGSTHRLLTRSARRTYDSLGHVVKTTTPDGLATCNEYDRARHVTKTTRNYVVGKQQNEDGIYNLVTSYEYRCNGCQSIRLNAEVIRRARLEVMLFWRLRDRTTHMRM